MDDKNDDLNVADDSDQIPTESDISNSAAASTDDGEDTRHPADTINEADIDSTSIPDEEDSDEEQKRAKESLMRTIKGEDQPLDFTTVPVIYRCDLKDPYGLAERYSPNEKNEWWYFVRPDKEAEGTGTDVSVKHDGKEVGSSSKKMERSARRGTRPQDGPGNWIMRTYILAEKDQTPSDNTTGVDPFLLNKWFLCKLTKGKKRKSQAIDEEAGTVEARGQDPKLGGVLEEQNTAGLEDPIGSQETGSNVIPESIQIEGQDENTEIPPEGENTLDSTPGPAARSQ